MCVCVCVCVVRPIQSKCCAYDFLTVEFNLCHLWLDWFFLRKLQKSKELSEKSIKRLSFNRLQTKRRLLYLKTQSVPRRKHFPSRL